MPELSSEGNSIAWRRLLLPLLCALIPLCLVWQGNIDNFGLEMDEGMLLLYPQSILDGSLPHKDFETFYTPGNLWLLAGVYWVFGNAIEVARTVGWLYQLAIVTGLFVLALPFGRWAAALAAFIAGLMLAPLSLTPFAWLLACALVLWAFIILIRFIPNKAEGKRHSFLPFLVGFLIGLALLVRQDVGLAMLLALCVLAVWRGFPSVLQGSIGIALALLPLGIHILFVGWQPFWENMVTYPIFETRAGRAFPFSAADPAEKILTGICFFSAIQSLVFAFFLRRQTHNSGNSNGLLNRTLIVWPFLFFSLVHQMLQRVEYIHVAFVAFLPMAMLFPPVFAFARTPRKTWIKVLALIPCAVAVVLFCSSEKLPVRYWNAFTRAFGLGSTGYSVTVDERRFYFRNEGRTIAAQAVVDFLLKESSSSNTDRLIVGPGDFSRTMANDTFFYYLLYGRLVPGTYFLEFNPGSANRPGTRLAADVAAADWVILNNYYLEWDEPNTSNLPGDLSADREFSKRFKRVFTAIIYEVYQKRSDIIEAAE